MSTGYTWPSIWPTFLISDIRALWRSFWPFVHNAHNTFHYLRDPHIIIMILELLNSYTYENKSILAIWMKHF